MKTNTSTLNPFALSYVPIAKREVDDVDRDDRTMPDKAAVADVITDVHDLKLKGHQADAAHGTYSENPHMTDFSIMDEGSEMDLAYLQMIFPGVSDQSLADVYNVNMGDLEAALDMLSILESADDQPSEVFNDDNTQDPVSSGESLFVKAVTAEDESSTSSSSSGVTIGTS